MTPRVAVLAAALAASAGVAQAADQHSAPVVRAVKRLANGRVGSCRLSCALIGRDYPRARLSVHRQGAYTGELAGLDDGLRRRIAAGAVLSPRGAGAVWVSGDVDKAAFSTPVELELDFGPDGLAGSEDPSSRWIVTSAHFHGALGAASAPHVYAAETAPVQKPESGLYFRFAP